MTITTPDQVPPPPPGPPSISLEGHRRNIVPQVHGKEKLPRVVTGITAIVPLAALLAISGRAVLEGVPGHQVQRVRLP